MIVKFRLAAVVSWLFVVYAALAPSHAQAQEDEPSALRVFLDCAPCDFDFVRQEIPYVTWMRDRQAAQLHVLVRWQATGGGGRRYTLDFMGLRDLEGKADTLHYTAEADATPHATRHGLTRVLQMGLVRHVAATPAADRIAIRFTPPENTPAAAALVPARDPWNAWVFTIGGNSFVNGESTQQFMNLNANVAANRITEAWKINLRASGGYNQQRFTYPLDETRDTTVTAIRRSYSGSALVVRSVSGHLSVGARAAVATSTFGNTRLSVSMAPAIEFNVYPYDESSRRRLLARYGPGLVSNDYREQTIFDRVSETRPTHTLAIEYGTRQPWGDVNFGVAGEQYLHDTGLYNLVISGGTSLNLVRGLRVFMYPTYMLIRDQLSLAKRGATPEEVLLRQRQVRTAYRYFMNVGLNYRFGSAVQNVVNPRFAGGGGVMIEVF